MINQSTISTAFLSGLSEVHNEVIDSKDLNEVGRKLAGNLDKIIRLGRDEDEVQSSLNVVRDFTVELLALKQGNSDIQLVRDNHRQNFANAGFTEDAMDIIENVVGLRRPPEPHAGLVDAVTIDNVELNNMAVHQADNSAELSKSKLLAEIFDPITEVMLKLNPTQQKNFLDQLSGIFKSNKDEQGNVTPEALTDVKEKIADLIKNYNPQALKEFVTKLDPAIKFELSSFFEQILKPGLEGGEMLLRAGAEINNKFKPSLVKILESRISANPEFETPSSEADLQRIQAKKDFVMYKVIEMSKDLEIKLKQSPTYDVEAHFQRGFDSLAAQLRDKSQQLYASDLSLLSSHLKATKTVSQDKQKLDVANFLQKHSKIALMALPMILGPIASVLSMIPIIGKPLAGLAPVINSFATQFGPYMFISFLNRGSAKEGSDAVQRAKDPDETSYVDLNQLQTAA